MSEVIKNNNVPNVPTKQLHWIEEIYFSMFVKEHDEAAYALDLFIGDIHASKVLTANKLFKQPESEKCVQGILNLLNSSNQRVVSNASYVVACLAESCWSLLYESMQHEEVFDCNEVVQILCRLLHRSENGIHMNSAGALGAIAEHDEGRQAILNSDDFSDMINVAMKLLGSTNLRTSNNAALIFARLSLASKGCSKILKHPRIKEILKNLVHAVGIDDVGRGVNAAFGLGRLLETQGGLELLLSLPEKDVILPHLLWMLKTSDIENGKNASYCLSCVSSSDIGHQLLLDSPVLVDFIEVLIKLIQNEDKEAAWFAALNIRIIVSQPKGCLKIREYESLPKILKTVGEAKRSPSDLRDEIRKINTFIKPLPKPEALYMEVCGGTTAKARWIPINLKSGFKVNYELVCGDKCVYRGDETSCTVNDLEPCQDITFKLRMHTEIDTSPFSNEVTIKMEESVPTRPLGLRTLVLTNSQVKIAWDPPLKTHGVFKNYCVLLGEKVLEYTHECTAIVSGLRPNTEYEISVTGCTAKGQGERAVIKVTTLALGTHAPTRVSLSAVGRSEMVVLWEPPAHPSGRIMRYEVQCGSRIVWMGTGTQCRVDGLLGNTEYTFTISVLTSVGRFESVPVKKRTGRDEYSDAHRNPLYPHGRRASDIAIKGFEPRVPRSKSSTGRRGSIPLTSGEPSMARRGSNTSTSGESSGRKSRRSPERKNAGESRRKSCGSLTLEEDDKIETET